MNGALAAHLWQSTAFACAAGLLTLAFRPNRAQVRYWLWLAASLKFLLPFTALMSLGSQVHWDPAARQVARQIAPPQFSIAMERMAQPFPARLPLTPAPASHWPAGMAGLWACGLAAFAILRLRSWLHVRAALRASRPVEIPAAVAVRSAPGLLEPGVVGWWRPVILLPDGIMERLTPAQLEAVMAHELCHVRRRDNLFAAMHMVVESVFWFHPLVWWIGARLVEERERACDEAVLHLGGEPRTYADAILNVCKLYVESPLVCVSGVTGANLKLRIEAIMMNRTGRGLNRARKLLLACAGAAALAGPVALGVMMGVGNAPAAHAQTAADPPHPQAAQAESPAPQEIPAQPAAPAQSAEVKYQDRRLVALLFDLDTMTADDQSRARKSAMDYVQGQMQSSDLVALMTANNGGVKVVEDFTSDRARLQSDIGGIGSAGGSVPSTSLRIERLQSATRMLGLLPQKKMLVYFSRGIDRVKADDPAGLQALIDTAVKSNVSLYPVDASGSVAQVLPPSAGGRGMVQASPPAGVSQEEYNRRLVYVKEKFGSPASAMARTYLRDGPPDQIEDRGANGQIWRYNYLESFHSNVELEFAPGKRANALRINWPPPVATFTGIAAADAPGFPGGHASMQTYPAGETQVLSVPLGSLSGEIAIEARVRSVPGADGSGSYAGMWDRFEVKDPSGTDLGNFVLAAGSYVCDVTVKEEATGQKYGETIYFQVK